MNLHLLPRWMKPCMAIFLVLAWLMAGSLMPLWAHSGATLTAPTNVAPVLDGTIDPAWGAGLPEGPLPNNCCEFTNMTPPPQVTFYALNDGTNLYLAFDIPDSSANINDTLFLFFDPNHGGGSNPAIDDRAIRLTFNNIAAVNQVPDAAFSSGTGAAWSAPVVGLPPGADARYTRQTAGTGKWQVEMKFPFTGPTVGFAFIYLNKITAMGVDCDGNGTPDPTDCNGDGVDDDFYTRWPSSLTISSPISLPAGIADPSAWGDLNFGPAPPTVSFLPPLCCFSTDISFVPSGQPFAAGVPVNIFATVHNLSTTTAANTVNVEIRVHNFGTGGTVIPPFPLQTSVPTIPSSGSNPSTPVTWPSPPPGIHGCIRAEIKPPTSSPYLIAGGSSLVQHNIDVAPLSKGKQKVLEFSTFNPEAKQAVKIILMKQVLLPPGYEGLNFELQQPERALQPQEEVHVRLVATVPDNVAVSNVPKQKAQVPPTAGGIATPRFRERSGTEAVAVEVKPGDRLYVAATGEVDIDGRGDLPPIGPNGQDVSKTIGEQRPFLLSGESARRYAGALIGSFDNFASSFVIGTETTLTVPNGMKELKLAVNDMEGGYGDNTGTGFEVEISTLSSVNAGGNSAPGFAIVPVAIAASAAKVDLPQVNITATSSARVTVGDVSYNLLTNYGSCTYQFLVVEDGAGSPKGLFGLPKLGIYGLSLLIIIVLILLILLFRRKKHAH